MSKKAALFTITAAIAAAVIFSRLYPEEDLLLPGTINAEESDDGVLEEEYITSIEDPSDNLTGDNEISYSRPEEESTYGPTGARGWIDFSTLEHRTEDESAPVVYFTDNISPEGLMNIYHALNVIPQGNVAVKVSTGESGNNHYLNPNLVKDLVHEVNGTIVECNTAEYGGLRSTTAMHYQIAADHGWSEIADVDIMDEFGTMSIPVTGGTYLTEDIVGDSLQYYDFVMVLSHFKGHAIGGFGGALKNISIGIASREGKSVIHSAGTDHIGFTQANQIAFTESMAEAAKAVYEYEGNGSKMLFINVMNNLSVDCDCISNPAAPTMANVGILASTDPVALDQACVDIVYAAPDGGDVQARIERQTGIHILEHADVLGFGSRFYRLNMIDG